MEAEGGIKLFNKACGKVLDVMQGGTADGTWAQTWEDVGGESQLWQLVNVSSTYKKIDLPPLFGYILEGAGGPVL